MLFFSISILHPLTFREEPLFLSDFLLFLHKISKIKCID